MIDQSLTLRYMLAIVPFSGARVTLNAEDFNSLIWTSLGNMNTADNTPAINTITKTAIRIYTLEQKKMDCNIKIDNY